MGWLIRLALVLLVLFLAVRAVWRFLVGIVDGATEGRRGVQPDRREALVRDPICGTFVVQSRALAVQNGATTHYFCSDECRRAYARGR